jgi:hypothetical protein
MNLGAILREYGIRSTTARFDGAPAKGLHPRRVHRRLGPLLPERRGARARATRVRPRRPGRRDRRAPGGGAVTAVTRVTPQVTARIGCYGFTRCYGSSRNSHRRGHHHAARRATPVHPARYGSSRNTSPRRNTQTGSEQHRYRRCRLSRLAPARPHARMPAWFSPEAYPR